MMTKLMMIGALATVCAAHELAAMPTEEEARRAEPVVRKMLAQERAALNSGKMTRSEVAAAAMGLADKAESEAEKLLLMKGACDFYVHAGEFDKAIETLQAMMMKIPDIPYATIVSILEYSLRGVSRNSAKDLWAFLDETKSRLRNTDTTHGKKAQSETNIQKFSRLFSGWEVCKEAQGRLGFELAYRGQFNVAVLHPVSQDIPAVVSRTLKLSGKNPCLFLKVSSCDYDGECDWVLSVRVNGKEVLPKRLINKTPNSEPWEDITVPLFAWRGQEVKVEVVVTANGWFCEFAYFKCLEIAEGSGHENLIPEAKETVDGYTWSYRVQNGEATIISEKEGKMSCAVSPKPVGSIVIPDILGGAKVTSIGREALAGCQELESVTTPQGVKRIGTCAFSGCKKLKSVEIPSSVIGIDWCAFYRCNALAAVNIPSDSDLKSLENGAFAECFALKSIALPDGVTSIARHAFLRCFNLKSLTIPATASSIGGEAFRYCVNLSSVTMLGEKPDTSVPPRRRPHTSDNIFLDCGKLKAIHVPANAKSWEGMKDWHGIPLVFDGDVAGTEVGASGIQTELREHKSERSVSEMTHTDNVRCTWSYADNNEGSLTITGVSLQTPSSVTIPTSFKGKNVTRIGNDAFRNNAMIKGVTIPGCIVGIGDRAFVGCANLEELTILEGVKAIGGSDAFRGCPKLKSVTIPQSLTFIRQRAFKNMPDEPMKVNVDSIEHWLSIVFGTGGSNPLCNGKSYLCVKGAPVVDLKIPDGTKEIKGCAFCGYSALKSISIPGSVQRIGPEAFAYMKGARILFASNIGTVEIAGGAFHSSSDCRIEVAPKPGWVFAGWEDEQGKLVDDILNQKQRIVVTPRWNRRKKGSVD